MQASLICLWMLASVPVEPPASVNAAPLAAFGLVADGSVSAPSAEVLALDFAAAIERGMAFGLGATLAEQEVMRARGQKRQVLGTALPTLSATGAFTHLDHTRELAGRVLMGQNQLNGNVLMQLPAVAPRVWGNVAQAERAVGVARDRRLRARRQIALDVGRSYLAALDVRHRLDVLEHAWANQKSHLDFAQARHEAGLATQLDVLRAEQALEETTVLRAAARAARVQLEEDLGSLIGHDGPVVPAEEVRLGGAPAAEEALAKMPWRREDVRAAQSELELARMVRHNSWLDYMPTLWALGAILSTHPPTPTAPKFGWQVQLLLSIPLYDGGVRDGERAERRALERESVHSIEAALRQSRSEVRRAYATLEEARVAVGAAGRSRKVAESARQLARQAYRTGTTGNLEVIDAERVALDAATQAIGAEDTLRRAQLELLAAAGLFPPPA